MDVADLKGVLTHVRDRFAVRDDAEVSIEANPDTVDIAKLEGLLAAGFDRLSMGAQSFDRGVLESLERLHSPDSVRRAFVAARAAGYENVNLDLIYGADGEGLDSWERTLEQAIDLSPEHISAYALTIEPATALGRKVSAGAVPAPDPDLQADMFSAACDLLRGAGYQHYEVSNWAKPGYECRHNLGYWERRSYVGLGAGAHSFRDDRRWWNVRPPEEYMERVEGGQLPTGGDERLDPSDAYLEEVFLRLRILQGIPSSWVDAACRPAVPGERPPARRRRLAGSHGARHAAAQRARPGARCELVRDDSLLPTASPERHRARPRTGAMVRRPERR